MDASVYIRPQKVLGPPLAHPPSLPHRGSLWGEATSKGSRSQGILRFLQVTMEMGKINQVGPATFTCHLRVIVEVKGQSEQLSGPGLRMRSGHCCQLRWSMNLHKAELPFTQLEKKCRGCNPRGITGVAVSPLEIQVAAIPGQSGEVFRMEMLVCHLSCSPDSAASSTHQRKGKL